MATTTTNLGLTKPALSESADVGVINDNSDKIDVEAGKSRANLAATYSASSAYAVGDYCERGGNLYRCTTAIPSGGEAWNSGHWTQVAVTGEIPKVINNLTSTSTSAALSAKQGKELNEKIEKPANIMRVLIAGSGRTNLALGEFPSGVVSAAIKRVVPAGEAGIDCNITVGLDTNATYGIKYGVVSATNAQTTVGSKTLIEWVRYTSTMVFIQLSYS